MYSLTKQYQYTNLTTGEGVITFIMIMLLAGSVILMPFTGVPHFRTAAIIMFIAGLIFVIKKVQKVKTETPSQKVDWKS